MALGTVRLPPKNTANPKNTGASTTLTSGPATATLTSSMGLSGKDFILASPPMGNSVMSCTSLPSLMATSECPNSCSKTQKNKATTRPTVTSAPSRLPESLNARKPKKARSKKKLQWTFTSIPKARPILKEPPIALSVPHAPEGDVIPNALLESGGGRTHRNLPSSHGNGRPCCHREGAARRRGHRRRHRD